MGRVNHVAVLLTVILQLAMGFVWYAEWAFGLIWMEGIGLDPSKLGQPEAHVFPIAIVGSFVIGYGMAWLLERAGVRGVAAGLKMGAAVGALLVAATLSIHHAFSTHSIAVMLVDSLKEIVTFALIAALLAALPRKGGEAEAAA